MTGRDRTCDAPRFRRALYRAELRSRIEDGRSRSRTGGLLRIREALYHLSYPPSGRGWARTSSLLFVRQALSRLSYSPLSDPGQGVEPRSPRSERGVLPVRRSRSDCRASPSSFPVGSSTQQANDTWWAITRVLCLVRPKPNDVFCATRLPFDPGSPTACCAHPRQSPSYVERLWSPYLAH